MGEDIHQKVYVKRHKDGKHYSAMDILSTWNTEWNDFKCLQPAKVKELIPDRYYDLFSLFGSRRGDWKELRYGHGGVPEWLETEIPLEHDMFQDYGNSYYGFVWFTYPELVKALTEYVEMLKDPKKYFAEDDDQWVEIMQASKEERLAMIKSWSESATGLIRYIEEMLSSLKGIEYYREDGYGKIIDIDETVFLFWFDN